MHAALFRSDPTKPRSSAADIARAVGLDMPRFQECAKTDWRYVKESVALARRLGVVVTPTFLIGDVDRRRGHIRVRRMIRGARPFVVFERVLEELLAR